MGVSRASGRLAVLASFSGDGGVERMLVNLLEGFVARGMAIDLLLIRASGPQLARLPEGIRVIKLPSDHAALNLRSLTAYLRKTRPPALLAAKHRALLVALWARRLAGTPTRIVGRIGTTVSAALEGKSRLRRIGWKISTHRFYRWADAIVAVSTGVAEDVRIMADLPPERVVVVPNPVVSARLHAMAQAVPDHPWFAGSGGGPLIIGMGRLTEQKDFPTLIRAFARVRRSRPCRLMILGRGRLLHDLEQLATELGVRNDVAFAGFVDNPYPWLVRAQLFVLSSAWEGSPNALTEALALGVPVVATDCPSGPREILQGGRYGPLVPVGDERALAAAIAAVLDGPPDPHTLREAVADYTIEAAARRYLMALGFPG
jgi:glycosyltransferase involved in cell wall biosynthesis